ncbi:MAG: hypothetical protein MUC96_33915 [Myxococcaceae bacterium]|nr:hypothetical protein [Myxococcaceae bacterium]
MSSSFRALAAGALVFASACPVIPGPERSELSSFSVQVEGVYTATPQGRTRLAVTAACASQYDGGQAAVPASVRGTESCRYVIARGPIEVDFVGQALRSDKSLVTGFSGPVSVRVIPGDFAEPIEWTSAVAGSLHGAGIRTDGSLWTWGDNASGQLGVAGLPEQFLPLPIEQASRFRVVAAGRRFTAAIRDDGRVVAFGALSGLLSNDADFTAIAAGDQHVLALKRDGTLWSAGENEAGQLGDGTTTSRTVLQQLGAERYLAIAAGGRHSLAVRADNTLWAFGANDDGQLGVMQANALTPVQVDATTTWRTVAAGAGHSLAIRTDGSLWAWGRNESAQLGLGSLTAVRTPTRVGTLTGWDSVSAGRTHSAGLRQPGLLYTWGSNGDGELGDNTTTLRNTPQPLGAATDWTSVSAGDAFTVATRSDSTVFTWGRNSLGQLGATLPALRDGGVDPFRRTPGRLRSPGYENRWRQAVGGEVRGVVRTIHQYGQVRLWLENAPPRPLFDGGTTTAPERLPPADTVYSYATGSSPIIWFEEQTLQSLNLPDGLDNRSSPFVGEFVRIGTPPEMGTPLRQTCLDDPERNGQPMAMVVTGVEPTGFYVSDITACRVKELLRSGTQFVRTPEPPEACQVAGDGGVRNIEDVPGATMGTCAISKASCRRRMDCASYSPGTFGSIFVFNFSFPEGLNQGDLLFSLSGAVQEFTSTTQMTFPAWTIAERVRLLPPDQWNKWLRLVPPVELNYRLCGADNVFSPFITDPLCGQSTNNLKLESLEASLVRVRGVKFPDRFVNCDFDANASVPFFCNRTDTDPNTGGTLRSWGSCDFDNPASAEPDNERRERECTQSCTLGRGPMGDQVCAEESTFIGFGQFTVEMAPPGPRWANLDDSSPARVRSTPVTATPVSQPDGGMAVAQARVAGLILAPEQGWDPGTYAVAVCDVPVRYRLGNAMTVVAENDPLLDARTVLKFRLPEGQDTIAFLPTSMSGTCFAAINPRTRLNLDTKDAIPELNPDCRVDDPNADAALQCRYTKGATYDVVGHLKQVQPARPRWIVIPRDPDDICCYPGAGLECPRPLSRCQGT